MLTPALNVLLVEDSDLDARLFTSRLQKEGAQVFRARSLGNAFAELESRSGLDVVVLDLTLPDSSGLATLDSLLARHPQFPIVILSANDDEDVAVRAVRQGAQDYVFKTDTDGKLAYRALRYGIERHQLKSIEREKIAIDRELSMAHEVQMKMLPSGPPKVYGFDVAGACVPTAKTGGDLFDFIQIRHSAILEGTQNLKTEDGGPPVKRHPVALVVADVSGHGVGAALVMVDARRALRDSFRISPEIGRVLAFANQAVCESTLDGQFVTTSIVVIDPHQGRVSYNGAGHLSWIIRANGDVCLLAATGIPLGLDEQPMYGHDGGLSVELGDTVLLMTDGLFECFGANGDAFGTEAVFDLIRTNPTMSAAAMVNHVIDCVQQHCAPATPQDDVTLVLAKVVS